MGSNFSQRKRLAEVLAQPIGHYQGWWFEIGCQACRDKRLLIVNRLLLSYDNQHSMQSVIGRLRCSVTTCRQPPSFVRLIRPSDGRSGKPAQEVMLVGPGAY